MVIGKLKKVTKVLTSENHICLHSVSDKTDPQLHAISFKKLRRLIKLIRRFGGFANLKDEADGIGKNNYCLTFDDGYHDLSEEAIPYLISNEIPFTIFLNASTFEGEILWRDQVRLIGNEGLIDEFLKFGRLAEMKYSKENFYSMSKSGAANTKELSGIISDFIKEKGLGYEQPLYLSKEIIQKLSAYPFVSFGNHTDTHQFLSSLTMQQQKDEIISGHKKLENLGITLNNSFAVPFGNNESINDQTISIVKDMRYKHLFLTNGFASVEDKWKSVDGISTYNRFLPKNDWF